MPLWVSTRLAQTCLSAGRPCWRHLLQVAEQTSEVARSTLEEAHRQGQQLASAAAGVEVIHEDVREASLLLRFMRRCVLAAAGKGGP